MKHDFSRSGEFTTLAIIFIATGILLIFDNIGLVSGIWRLWPVYPLLLGVGGIWFYQKGNKKDLKPLAIGIFLIITSLFFFYLNYTTWKRVAVLWPIFIAAFGITLVSISIPAKRKKWLRYSGLFFILLSILFFVVFTVGVEYWPVSLILFGLWLFLIPERRNRDAKECFNSRTEVEQC